MPLQCMPLQSQKVLLFNDPKGASGLVGRLRLSLRDTSTTGDLAGVGSKVEKGVRRTTSKLQGRSLSMCTILKAIELSIS